MLFCIVTFNLWLHYNKLLTYLLTLKESVISPLLKKPTLDKDELSNYRPFSTSLLYQK